MSTLNEIAQGLADSVNQSTNHNLKERLKLSFRNFFAERMRQDIERNGLSVGYSTRLILPLTSADISLACLLTVDCLVLRTTNIIVMPTRLKGRVPFNYVGFIDGKKGFTYVSYRDVEDFSNLRYIGNEIYWDIVNGYLLIFNAKRIENVMVEGYYTATDILDCSVGTETCITDDTEFPAPADMVESVKMQVRKSELLMYETHKEVFINPEIPVTDGRTR